LLFTGSLDLFERRFLPPLTLFVDDGFPPEMFLQREAAFFPNERLPALETDVGCAFFGTGAVSKTDHFRPPRHTETFLLSPMALLGLTPSSLI